MSEIKEADFFQPGIFPQVRLQRLRQHEKLRELTAENRLSIKDLVFPLFVKAGLAQKHPIKSMPGLYQLCLADLDEEIKQISQLQIPAVILFGIPSYKDAIGSSAFQADGIMQQAIQRIKTINSKLLIIADLCFCEYTDHGHCGVIIKKENNFMIENDETLRLLAQQAISLVEAGADVIAPSGMMDGVVQAVRKALDQHHFQQIPILSYSAKYASAFYGPFRDAAEGAPQFGDRRSYQMDPANGYRALRESALDVQEGADILMVKPAGPYLDVIYRIKQQFPYLPLCAYQVSGEYAMLKAAAQNGWLDAQKTMLESLLAIKRAGADFIITYFAKEVGEVLKA